MADFQVLCGLVRREEFTQEDFEEVKRWLKEKLSELEIIRRLSPILKRPLSETLLKILEYRGVNLSWKNFLTYIGCE